MCRACRADKLLGMSEQFVRDACGNSFRPELIAAALEITRNCNNGFSLKGKLLTHKIQLRTPPFPTPQQAEKAFQELVEEVKAVAKNQKIRIAHLQQQTQIPWRSKQIQHRLTNTPVRQRLLDTQIEIQLKGKEAHVEDKEDRKVEQEVESNRMLLKAISKNFHRDFVKLCEQCQVQHLLQCATVSTALPLDKDYVQTNALGAWNNDSDQAVGDTGIMPVIQLLMHLSQQADEHVFPYGFLCFLPEEFEQRLWYIGAKEPRRIHLVEMSDNFAYPQAGPMAFTSYIGDKVSIKAEPETGCKS